MLSRMIDAQNMELGTLSWLSVVLLVHAASGLCARESISFAAVSKRSGGQMFLQACSTCILMCDSGAVVFM